MEARSPGAKAAFYLSFLDNIAPRLASTRAAVVESLSRCSRCGAPTTGSGLGGLLVLGAMSLIAPEHLLLVPLLLWLAGSVFWFSALASSAARWQRSWWIVFWWRNLAAKNAIGAGSKRSKRWATTNG